MMKNKTMKLVLIILVGLNLLSCTTTPAGGKAFLLTSISQENAQGEQVYQDILKTSKVITNTKQSQMVQEIGTRIAAIANRADFQWEFKTIESDEPNAFCLPGGKVAVYTGIFKYAKNEAGLATIMGHEIGHALARHGGQRVSQQQATNVALAGLAVIGLSKMEPSTKALVLSALGVGATIGVALPFSRRHETEADEIGLELMARAGYFPGEAVNFWDRFSQASSGSKSAPVFLSTHPPSATRRDHLRELLPKVEAFYQSSPKYGIGREL